MERPDTLLLAISWLAGGLGLFLYGVNALSEGLRHVADERLRRVLSKTTGSPVIGLAVGAIATGILQSSSATTVMVVGFVDAGLLTLQQTVGIILGSGIGSTVTAQLISFPWIETVALPAIGIGLFAYLFVPRKAVKLAGKVVFGLGLIFFGFLLMKLSVSHWQDTTIRGWFEYLGQPSALSTVLSVLVAAAATAVVQSSGATIGMIVALAHEGIIPDLHAALPLIVGCNIGTTITAVLASIGSTVTAKRAAGVHVVYRILGGVATLVLARVYLWYIPHTATTMSRQIANLHTVSNIANGLLFLPFGHVLVWLPKKLLRGREDLTPAPLFIDFGQDPEPTVALSLARKETLRLAVIAREMTGDAVEGLVRNDHRLLDSVLTREDIVDSLRDTTTQYLTTQERNIHRVGGKFAFLGLRQVLHHIERVADHAENIVDIARLRMKRLVFFSDEMLHDVKEAGLRIDRLALEAVRAIRDDDEATVARIGRLRHAFKAYCRQLREKCYAALRDEDCEPLVAAIYEDYLENLASAATHLKKAVHALFGFQQELEPDDDE